MKNVLVISTTVFWILAGLLILALHPGCADYRNIKQQQKVTDAPPTVQMSQAQESGKRQWASNTQGTLYGENLGDSIVLNWELDDRAAEYFVYRATSLNGPWKQVLRTSQAAATTGGARVDLTPDARLMDLCYKVELIDAKGLVIETYEPICVPKFVP